MTDAELRGRLLSHFYNLRHQNGGYVPVSDMTLGGAEGVTLGLIEWSGYLGQGPDIGSDKIRLTFGVDAREQKKSS